MTFSKSGFGLKILCGVFRLGRKFPTTRCCGCEFDVVNATDHGISDLARVVNVANNHHFDIKSDKDFQR